MFFKRIFFFIFSFLILTGCSNWWGGKQQENGIWKGENFNTTTTEGPCSFNFEEISNKFISGTIHKEEINHIIVCALTTLEENKEKIITKTQGEVTDNEIKVLIKSFFLPKVSGGQIKLDIWIERIFSLKDLILGPKNPTKQRIFKYSEMTQVLNRFQKISPEIEMASQKFQELKTYKTLDPHSYQLRKEILSLYIKMIKTMLQNERGKVIHDLPRDLVLNQYNLWDGLDKGIGKHYIEATYLSHRLLYGHPEENLLKDILVPLFKNIEDMYGIFSDIHYYQNLTDITTESSVQFLVHYYKLLEYIFKLFEDNHQKTISREDLTKLFNLLQTEINGNSHLFVQGLFELKIYICGGSPDLLTANEVRKLRAINQKIFQDYERSLRLFEGLRQESVTRHDINRFTINNLEKFKNNEEGFSRNDFVSYQKMYENFPRITQYWKSPFEVTEGIQKYDFILSQIALTITESILDAYDKDKNSEVALGEINETELSSLMKTIQLLVKGFYLLISNPNATDSNTKLFELNEEESLFFSKILSFLTDRFFHNSNGNGILDKYEVLEVISFLFETRKNARAFFEETKKIEDPHYILAEARELPQNDETVRNLRDTSLIFKYFPHSHFELSKEDLEKYISKILGALGKTLDEQVSFKDIEIIFGMIRLIEMIFTKYDLDLNGVLYKTELDLLYTDLEPFFGPVLEKKIKESKTKLRFYENWFAEDNTTIKRKFFDYAVCFGEVTIIYKDLEKLDKKLEKVEAQKEKVKAEANKNRYFWESLSQDQQAELDKKLALLEEKKIETNRLLIMSLLTDIMHNDSLFK
ncbi:MAG: hypothetical protein HYW47_00190 [Deltaproteobacteria bacterium]|nr:hypothetical protein [Deltaproteobacteria bacterium]